MKKIIIIGNYGNKSTTYGGQYTKTKNVNEYLVNYYGNRVVSINLYRYKYRFPIILFQLVFCLIQAKSVIIMPAVNGLKKILPFTSILKKFLKYRLYYDVIGGWLPGVLSNNDRLLGHASKLDGIFVETQTMVKLLNDINLNNVYCVPNFSLRQNNDKESSLTYRFMEIKMMTFSRVNREKGISLAIDTINQYNSLNQEKIYLDIYGFLDPEYKSEFMILLENNPFIKYAGPIKNNVISVLSQYYGMLFPTFYPGEGFPGAVIESMIAGVPIIASNWKYNPEIIKHKYNGLIFDLNSSSGFYDCIKWSIENKDEFLSMRKNCINEAEKYTPKNTMKTIVDMINNN